MSKRIIVIGSGFGGLAAAVRLQAAGHEVHILERRDKLGGRAYVYEKDGFHFDGGPTVITAPYMFDDLFTTAGRERQDYVEFVPCDPFYRIYDHNKKYFDYNGDTNFILEQIDRWNPADKTNYLQFIKGIKDIFETGMGLIETPFLKFSDMLKVVPDLVRLQSYRSVYGYVSQFIEDDFLRRCFSFHPLLIGGNPFDSTSIYALIHYLEREWGVWYAMGGTGAIVAGLGKVFEEIGGTITLNADVDQILIDGNQKATGVRLTDGTEYAADVVVSNADVATTYMKMIDKKHRGLRNSNYRYRNLTRYSMSLFVIYFGTKKRYLDSGLRHHNIILGERYKYLLDDIFNKKDLPEDFSLYLHMPTITDPSIAPEGCENFYVLSPVPHLGSKTNWSRMAPIYRNKIMQFLEDNYLPDLQENIVAEHYIDPAHFQNTLNSYQGAAFSVQPILTQSAWFRPHNQSEDIDNLYFVGAGTHPGAGLPGVLASGKIAADLIGAGVPAREAADPQLAMA